MEVFAPHLDALRRRVGPAPQALPGRGGAQRVEHMQPGPVARFAAPRAHRAAAVRVLLLSARRAGGFGLRLALLAQLQRRQQPGRQGGLHGFDELVFQRLGIGWWRWRFRLVFILGRVVGRWIGVGWAVSFRRLFRLFGRFL